MRFLRTIKSTSLATVALVFALIGNTATAQTDTVRYITKDIISNEKNNDWQNTSKTSIRFTDKLKNYLVIDGEKLPNQDSWLWERYWNPDKWAKELVANLDKGWEWATQGNLRYVEQSYPTSLSYYVSDAHPEYIIIDNAAYTKDGKLVRIIKCIHDINEKYDDNRPAKAILNYLYRKDYEANKYNIKEKGEKTQKYIMRKLGYASAQKSKQEKVRDKQEAWKAIETFQQSYQERERAKMEQIYARTNAEYQKAKQAEKRANMQILEILTSASDSDRDGEAYLKQLEIDHKGSEGIMYYFGRNDDTSFILKFTGKKHSYTVKLVYTQDKPFSNEHTTIFVSEDERISINDFRPIRY